MSREISFGDALENFLSARDSLKSVAARCGHSHLDSALADPQLNGEYMETKAILNSAVEKIQDDIRELRSDAEYERERKRWEGYPG